VPVTTAAETETSPTLEVEAGRPVLRDRLGRARGLLAGYFDQVRGRKAIDEATFEELEEALILADVGVTTTTRVLGTFGTNCAAVSFLRPTRRLSSRRSRTISSRCSRAMSSRLPTPMATGRPCGSSSA